MLMDSENLFSDAQAITSAAASTNLIDLGTANSRLGNGQPLYIRVQVDTTFADTGSDSTQTVTLEQDTTAAFGSATAVQTICTIGALQAAGSVFNAIIAPGVVTEQFIRLYFTPANGDTSAGAVTAMIVPSIQDDAVLPDNITIS